MFHNRNVISHQFSKFLRCSLAAVLKKGRQKFSPHFLEVHGGQIFYLTPYDDKTIKKPTSELHGHGT